MTNADIDFFQSIINEILRYITRAEIKNEKDEQHALNQRALFRLFSPTAEAVPTEVSQPNKQNLKFWTVKEIKDMPFLKDLKYRRLQSGIHQFRYRRDGFDMAFSSKNFETAKDKARAFIIDLKRKIGADIKSKHINSLNHVAQLWFENKKSHVSFETWRGYKSVYKNHIQSAFGCRTVSTILPMDLQPFFNALYGKLGKTCENAKIILNGIFDFAVANSLCQSNPMHGVIIDRHYRTPGVALSDEQLERFRIAMAAPDGACTAYLIILFSGIRGAELHNMTFDWDKGTFTVNNAKLKKSQKVNVSNLKRTVPIFPALYAIRNRIERDDWRLEPRKVSDYLCKYWTESTVKDLRHTFISRARQSGVDNELVNLWTGHLPGKNVTANIYTHFSIEYQKEQAKKVNI